MSDLLAQVLIGAARGIIAATDGGAKTPAPQAATKADTKAAPAAKAPAIAATSAANKPATKAATTQAKAPAKPAAPKAPAKPAVATDHSEDEVRKAIRAVANHPKLGMKIASNILDEEAGVANVSSLKPENYDAVFDACTAKIAEANGQVPETNSGEEGDGTEEFDPTA